MDPADPLAALLRPQHVRPLVLSEMHSVDLLAASLRPQYVCRLVHSLKWTLLTLLRPCSALRMYAPSSYGNAPC